jgi:hypothetical protein
VGETPHSRANVPALAKATESGRSNIALAKVASFSGSMIFFATITDLSSSIDFDD